MRFPIIAIEREYASGGSQIGARISKELGVKCYSKEILEMASARMGSSVEELRDIEETMTGSFLYSVYLMAGGPVSGSRPAGAQQLSMVESEIIRELAAKPCVFVGRGACGVLEDQPRVLKVFVHADLDFRRQRAKEVYGIEPSQVDTVLRGFDRRRAEYFKATIGRNWRDCELYHMLLDSGRLGIDTVVDMLLLAAK